MEDDAEERVTDELIESVRRDLRRAERWERIHDGYLTLLGVLAGVVYVAYWTAREWAIWFR